MKNIFNLKTCSWILKHCLIATGIYFCMNIIVRPKSVEASDYHIIIKPRISEDCPSKESLDLMSPDELQKYLQSLEGEGDTLIFQQHELVGRETIVKSAFSGKTESFTTVKRYLSQESVNEVKQDFQTILLRSALYFVINTESNPDNSFLRKNNLPTSRTIVSLKVNPETKVVDLTICPSFALSEIQSQSNKPDLNITIYISLAYLTFNQQLNIHSIGSKGEVLKIDLGNLYTDLSNGVKDQFEIKLPTGVRLSESTQMAFSVFAE
jgi:hypothetical protein